MTSIVYRYRAVCKWITFARYIFFTHPDSRFVSCHFELPVRKKHKKFEAEKGRWGLVLVRVASKYFFFSTLRKMKIFFFSWNSLRYVVKKNIVVEARQKYVTKDKAKKKSSTPCVLYIFKDICLFFCFVFSSFYSFAPFFLSLLILSLYIFGTICRDIIMIIVRAADKKRCIRVYTLVGLFHPLAALLERKRKTHFHIQIYVRIHLSTYV